MNSCSLTFRLMACAVALAAAGCNGAPGKPGPEPETPRPEQVLDFATLYGQNCAACHGDHGKNGAAISLANPTYLAIAGASDIERITANGVPGTAMPLFSNSKGGTLTGQQISVLAQGMVSSWGNPAALAGQAPPAYAASTTGNPAQGQKAFATYCERCHGADGNGASAGNGVATGSLIDPAYLALISDQGLRSIIVAGQTEQGPHDWRSYLTGPAAHSMSDQEITDVVAVAPPRIASQPRGNLTSSGRSRSGEAYERTRTTRSFYPAQQRRRAQSRRSPALAPRVSLQAFGHAECSRWSCAGCSAGGLLAWPGAQEKRKHRSVDHPRQHRPVPCRRNPPCRLSQSSRQLRRRRHRQGRLLGPPRIRAAGFQVFAVNCAHLGCPVRWFAQSKLFLCPCHGGAYYEDGSRASGPPERGLFEYRYQLTGTSLMIHAGDMPTLATQASCHKPKPLTQIAPATVESASARSEWQA